MKSQGENDDNRMHLDDIYLSLIHLYTNLENFFNKHASFFPFISIFKIMGISRNYLSF